ncbi:MAG: hypothetical protein SGPRY_001936, partial [Prymnesium sp.]
RAKSMASKNERVVEMKMMGSLGGVALFRETTTETLSCFSETSKKKMKHLETEKNRKEERRRELNLQERTLALQKEKERRTWHRKKKRPRWMQKRINACWTS